VSTLIQTLVAYFVGFTIEGMSPADESNTAKNLLFNATCTVFYFVAEALLAVPLVLGVYALLNRLHIYGLMNFPSLGLLATAPLWLAVHDFFYYWLHRFQHHSRWLWAEHMLHHSDEHMNVTTATRHHWLEKPLEVIFIDAPMLILFRPPVAAAILLSALPYAWGYFIHLNSNLSLGPLNRILANPRTHRIHHSNSPEHFNKNFAAFFPMWDVIFGTYFAPDKRSITCGLSDKKITTVSEALLGPFLEWARMIKPAKLPRATDLVPSSDTTI
jgi:sterol desaturase/sphingolipid hydroxylase (fatty acid hydroxylase superfamily)